MKIVLFIQKKVLQLLRHHLQKDQHRNNKHGKVIGPLQTLAENGKFFANNVSELQIIRCANIGVQDMEFLQHSLKQKIPEQ